MFTEPKFPALIVSRVSDLPMAYLSADRLERQGWSPVIIADKRETLEVPKNDKWPVRRERYITRRGMYGVSCAIAVSNILASLEGDVLGRFDCDVWLSDEVSEWLKRTHWHARCLTLTDWRMWGGFWACSRPQLEKVQERLATLSECECNESLLFLAGHRCTGGMEAHPTRWAVPWIPSRPWPDKGMGAVTLPTRCSTPRLESGLALFSHA